MTALMTKPSNLYGFQLRPRNQDSLSKVVNPAFSIERRNDASGTALSPLYNAMHSRFSTTVPVSRDPRASLTKAVLAALPPLPTVADIQHVLRKQCKSLFGLSIDFRKSADGKVVDKAAIDTLMGFEEDTPTPPQEYTEALLGMCSPNILENIPTPPFYSIPKETPTEERTERLSILTQFFLAHVTIYCKARGISTHNFGTSLDASPTLSNELVSGVATALSAGDEVETQLCAFCNVHATEFGLSRSLNVEDVTAIKQKFERTYRTVTVTKENPHMDDFLILDKEATGTTAKFVTHQGAICVDFAEVVDAVLPNQDYFAAIRKDFAGHPAEIAHKNESIAGEVDLEIETLLARVNDEQFEKLPEAVKKACGTHSSFKFRRFLHEVAKGNSEEAEALMPYLPDDIQTFLRVPGVFTDYSDRTFNCTAYEYAYWAKDTIMCRWLEYFMDEKTKTQMLARINEMERIDAATGRAVGLAYQQHGETHRTNHFDLTPLKQALKQYIDGYKDWRAASDWDAIHTAWMVIGKAQRDVPAHLAQEYCSPDRSFYTQRTFREIGSRQLVFYKSDAEHAAKSKYSWFPLGASTTSGLGVDFALTRGLSHYCEAFSGDGDVMTFLYSPYDLAAVTRIDEVRTADLTALQNRLNRQSKKNFERAELKRPDPTHQPSCCVIS